MNTKMVLTGAIGVLGTMVMTTGLAFSQPEYLHFTRHRDSNGNLLMAPAHPGNSHAEVQEPKVTPSALSVAPMEPSDPIVPAPQVTETQESAPQVSETQETTAQATDIQESIPQEPETQESAPQVSDAQESPSVVQKTVVPSQPNSVERQRVDWGMSVVDVKGNELIPPTWEVRAPIVEEFEHRVAYHTQIEGIDTSLSYTFYQDQLAQAKYVFEPKHEDASEYVQDFHAVQEWITQSYGPPTSVQEIWLDSLYQYDRSLWGQALLRGHLILVAEWKTSESQIALVLNGGDDTVGMVADFSSQQIQPPAPLVDEAPLAEVAPETTTTEPKPAMSL